VTRSPFSRIVAFFLLATGAVFLYVFLLSLLRGKLGAWSQALPAFVLAVCLAFLNWRFLRAEGRPAHAIGADRPGLRLGQFLGGFVAGAVVVALWAIVLRLATGASWHAVSPGAGVVIAGQLTFLAFNNLAEELAYRAWLFMAMTERWGAGAAIGITSLVFAAAHVQGGVPWSSALAGVFTSGLLYAAVFLRWRSVPLTLGVHLAANVLQEVAGLRVSGLNLWAIDFASPVDASRGVLVLAGVAAVNLTAFAAVMLIRRARS
jgi:membrane protease YdiL (CAAX protease family)